MTSATEERLTSISSEDSLDTHDANKRFPPYSRVSIVIPHVPISSPIIPIPLGTAPDPVFRPQYPIPFESSSDTMLRATKERLALTSGDDSRVSITFQQPSGPSHGPVRDYQQTSQASKRSRCFRFVAASCSALL
jgi:hypothetical protein